MLHRSKKYLSCFCRENKKIIILLILVFCLNLFFLIKFPADPQTEINDPMAYSLLAKNINRYHTFGERFAGGAGLHLFHTMPGGAKASTTYRPPGYPFFLSLLYRFSEGYYFIALTQVLLSIFSLFLAFRLIAKYFSGTIALGTIALYSLIPTLYRLNISLWTESFVQSMLIISIYLYLNSNKLWHKATAGLIFSWVILAKPTYLPYLVVLGLYLIYKLCKHRRINRGLAWFTLAALLPILAWSARSSLIDCTPVIISSNSGVNFFLSNNPYVSNGRAASWPPLEILSRNGIDINRIDHNESKISQKFNSMAFEWIRYNPWLFLRFSINKLVYLFSPIETAFLSPDNYARLNVSKMLFLGINLWSTLSFFALFFLAVIGIFYLKNRRALLLFLPYLAMIVLTFSDSRFLFPLLLPIALLASIALSSLPHWPKRPTYLLLALLVIIYQLGYFGTYLSKNYYSLKDVYAKKKNISRLVEAKEDKAVITDAFLASANAKIMIKKSNLNNLDNKAFYLDGSLVPEDVIISKMNSGGLYTDLLSVFSGLDPKTYPHLAENNLVIDTLLPRPMYRVVPAIDLPQPAIEKHLNSNLPNQPLAIDEIKVGRGETLYLEIETSAEAKVVILNNRSRKYLPLAASFNEEGRIKAKLLFDTANLPPDFNNFSVALINQFGFPDPHQYNILINYRDGFSSDKIFIKSFSVFKAPGD